MRSLIVKAVAALVGAAAVGVIAPVSLAQNAPPPGGPQPGAQPNGPVSPETLATARINAQIEALLAPPSGGFAMTYYARPAPLPPPMPGQPDMVPRPAPRRDNQARPENYVVAKPGDITYATIDRAFNSDDPQAPLFATIHDVDALGKRGPLDDVRLLGTITYSKSQGAIQFNQAYLGDGRPLHFKAIAISEDDARTGVAKDVDTHDIERYGGLLFATLVQGAGQAGQTLLQNNQQLTTDPTTGAVTYSQKVDPYQVALAGIQPVGQALTAVAAQGFNRPATISGPAGMGIGVIFLDAVAVPRDVIFGRGR